MLYRLEFPNLKSLNAFVPSLGSCRKVVNPRTLVVVCFCAEEQTVVAKEKFGADVMTIQP